MIKILKRIGWVALGALLLLQFIQPDKNEQGYESVMAFEQETGVSVELGSFLRTICYDCHSNQTTYPWYSNIAPLNYWLEEHVVDGKKHFNVSEWSAYSDKKKDHKLDELIEEVEAGEMPLPSYQYVHGCLTQQERKTLTDWAQMTRLNYQEAIEALNH